MSPEVMLSRVSEAAQEWGTSGVIGRRCAINDGLARYALLAMGAEQRTAGRTDRRGRPITEYRTQRISPGRAAELILGGYWREVREGDRRGGHVPATGEAWMAPGQGGAIWLHAVTARCAGLHVRWRDGIAYLSLLPTGPAEDGDDEPTAVDLLDYYAAGEWRLDPGALTM